MAVRGFNQYLACITINIASLAIGTVVGWTSPSLPILSSSSKTPLEEPLSADAASWVASVIALGALVGAISFGYIAELMGRKIAGYLMGILFVIQWVTIIYATLAWHLYVGRTVGGIAMGGTMVIVPLFVAEIAEVRIRGRLGALFALIQIFGVLFVYVIGAYVSYYVLLYVCLSLPVIFLVCLPFLPETPIYLMRNNKDKEAIESLRWYRGIGESINNKDLDTEIEVLKSSVMKVSDEPDQQDGVHIKELFQGVNLRGLVIGTILVTVQQFCGGGTIVSFAVDIFTSTGGTFDPNQSAIMAATMRVLGCCVAVLLVEKLGRKILLIGSSVGVALSHLTLGSFLYAKHLGADVTSFGWIPVTALSVFFFFMAGGIGPLPAVVISEVFSPKMRGISSSICMFMLWTQRFIVLQTFYPMEQSFGLYGTFWFYGVVVIFGLIFFIFFIPDTKGRPIDEILKDIGGKIIHLPQ